MALRNVRTLLQLTISPVIDNVPHGTIKLVRGIVHKRGQEPETTYAIFVQDKYLGTLPDMEDDRQAVLLGLTKMRELVEFLSKDSPDLTSLVPESEGEEEEEEDI